MQRNEKASKRSLGVEVLQGCNLMQLARPQVSEFKKSLYQNGVVVARQLGLRASELQDFAKTTFGEEPRDIFADLRSESNPKAQDPEIDERLQSSGVLLLGNPKGYTQEIMRKNKSHDWHHDKDHLPKTEGLNMNSLYVVMLYGIEVPLGLDGQNHTTQFLDMVEAYNNLAPTHQKELEKMSMYHLYPFLKEPISPATWAEIPKKIHPIVSSHKVTGVKGLYLGSDTSVVVGQETNLEEAQKYWDDLLQTVIARTAVYKHIWQPGDLVFWDNSQVMHCGTLYDSTKYKRVALRAGVVDYLTESVF